MTIEITLPVTGSRALKQETWRFWFYESRRALVLDKYEFQERSTTRHKFQTARVYTRVPVNAQEWHAQTIEERDVPLSDELKADVLERFMKSIRVVTWSEETKR